MAMDQLTNVLLQRQLNNPTSGGQAPATNGFTRTTTPIQSTAPPPVVGPNPDPKIPPANDRFNNAQQIQEAYRNGWNPNPVLLRAQLGK